MRKLQGLRGVGSVDRIGSVEREIRVGLNPIALQGVGVTAVDVSRQLRGSNADLAGGRTEIGERNQAVRTLAGARSLTELAGTRIALPRGGDVRLDDIGHVTDTIAEPTTFARFNGSRSWGFPSCARKGVSLAPSESASRSRAGSRSLTTRSSAAKCTADGKTSFEDCPMFTSSFGCTPSPASVAITSLAFVFEDVPEPVWKTSIGNWSSSSPFAIRSAAGSDRSASSPDRATRARR